MLSSAIIALRAKPATGTPAREHCVSIMKALREHSRIARGAL
jgi:hypothetical protein